MSHRVCPWWIGYFLINPLRRWSQNPVEILSPFVREGMMVLEPGPGMGFFTLALARLVGPSGRVVAVDVQPKMIARLKRRAAKAGLLDRIDARIVRSDTMALQDFGGKIDFTLAFAMLHEFPDASHFFTELAVALKGQGQVLLAEPRGHVSEHAFQQEIQAAQAAGFTIGLHPQIRRSHAVLLTKC